MKKFITVVIICGAVLTLSALGTWQIQRLAWKQEIIDNLEKEYLKEPIEFAYDIQTLNDLSSEDKPILYGSVFGNFMQSAPIFIQPKTHNGKVGAHVIQPFKIKSGGIVFINRGWAAQEKIKGFQSETTADYAEGIFRKADWNKHTPNNSPSQNIWSKADVKEMADYLEIENYAPVILYATSIENNDGLILQDAKWYPRNKHFQYAIFWYGMIFVLLGLIALAAKPKKKAH